MVEGDFLSFLHMCACESQCTETVDADAAGLASREANGHGESEEAANAVRAGIHRSQWEDAGTGEVEQAGNSEPTAADMVRAAILEEQCTIMYFLR